MLFYKSHDCTVQKKLTPTEGDLELIQAYAPEPIDAEKLFIGRMSLANDQYDRSFERFPTEYLQRFADTIPGKGVMTGHDYKQEPSGTFFGGEVQERQGRKELITRYYLLDSSELAAKVKAGIARSVSIGFNPDRRLCDIDGKNYDGWMQGEENACEHIAGRDYDGKHCTVTYGGDAQKVEAVEGSFVWLGCQYGAEAIGGNGALSPRAKSAYFDSLDRQGVWQVPDLAWMAQHGGTETIRRVSSQLITAQKEALMSDTKGQVPPAEVKLSPEQERLIALGEAYVKFAQAHVKSRYGACKQERTGERLAASIERASVEEIAEELKAADDAFNEKFPGTGKGVPMSDQPAEPMAPRQFNPLRRVRG